MNSYGDSAVLVQADLTTGWGGQQVRDWANAERVTVACSVQPRNTAEFVDQRQVTTTDKVMHAAPDAGVRSVDRVEWRGGTYEVEGEPALHFQQGTPDHLEVVLNLIAEASA